MVWLRPYEKIRTGVVAPNPLYVRLQALFEEICDPPRREFYIQSRGPTLGMGEGADDVIDPINRDDIGPSERSLLHYFNRAGREMATLVGDRRTFAIAFAASASSWAI